MQRILAVNRLRRIRIAALEEQRVRPLLEGERDWVGVHPLPCRVGSLHQGLGSPAIDGDMEILIIIGGFF